MRKKVDHRLLDWAKNCAASTTNPSRWCVNVNRELETTSSGRGAKGGKCMMNVVCLAVWKHHKMAGTLKENGIHEEFIKSTFYT